MSLISELILRVRYNINDMDRMTSDYTMLHYYNEANRALRRIILEQNPMMLAITETGNTVANQAANTLANKPIRVLELRLDNRRINPVSLRDILDKTSKGKPFSYYVSGTQTINWHYVPDAVYPFEVTLIPEGTVKDDTVDSGYAAEIEDLLVGYVTAKVSGNPAAITSADVIRIIGNLSPQDTVIDGYYGSSYKSRDYGN